MVNLLKDVSLKFEKRAMETQLSDNSDNYQQEVASELYRQAPYVSNYATDVILDKVDAQRGYGYGTVTLKNKYDMPQPEQDSRALQIPIIIKDRMLKPFDVYKYENRWYPLSEQRVSQALFKTQPLELTDRKPTDKMISPQMYPPTRSHVNATVSTAGFGKYASVLDAILPTLSNGQVTTFLQKIAESEALQQAYLDRPAFRNSINKIASVINPDIKKEEVSVAPTVIQLIKTSAKTFIMKTANINVFEPKTELISTADVAEQIGDKAYEIEPGTTINASILGPVTTSRPLGTKIADSAGTYKCQDSQGRDVFGSILPMTSLKGEPTGESLFINDKSYGIGEKIAGKKIANEVSLSESIPSGYGTFVNPNTDTATQPVTIQYSTINQSGNKTHVGTDQLGKPINIISHPQVAKLAQISNNAYVMPADMKWVELPKAEISIRSESEDAIKIAAAKNTLNTLDIRKFGDEYSISGFPVEKLANNDKNYLSRTEAEFLITATGLDASVLDNVTEKTAYKVVGARTIIPAYLAKEAARKEATKIASKFPNIKRDLVKEAATFNDEETVDNILSLGFLGPDNVKGFADYLPELEKTNNKLADLLFASRCGLSTVPEEAVESAMRNTDSVISGLRTLQEQEMM